MPRPWAKLLLQYLKTFLVLSILSPFAVDAAASAPINSSVFTNVSIAGDPDEWDECKAHFKGLYKYGLDSGEGQNFFRQFLHYGHVDNLIKLSAREAIQNENGSLLFVRKEACEAVCTTGPQYYPWGTSAATLTTWILPLIGLVLQLPFDSSTITAALLLVCRWLGNPISSLTAELWNLRVIGKCAKFADLAESGSETAARPDSSSFSNASERSVRDVRDSLFLLSTFNQYRFNHELHHTEFRCLLMTALFENNKELAQQRREIADLIRFDRKRGVVILFGSIFWFTVSLVISIQTAFGDEELGKNSQAHNMALGVLMIWLPMIVVFSIIDRNPVHPEEVMGLLNTLLTCTYHTYDILSRPRDNEATTETLNEPSTAQPHRRRNLIRRRTAKLVVSKILGKERNTSIAALLRSRDRDVDTTKLVMPFLLEFAGQGRSQWHYGIGHSFLRMLENRIVFLQKHHRKILIEELVRNNYYPRIGPIKDKEFISPRRNWAWFYEESLISNFSMLNTEDRQQFSELNVIGDLTNFDFGEALQILCTFTIILMPALGAFIISYNTPTVGLGCRSGGYVVFSCLITGAYLCEVIGWIAVSSHNKRRRDNHDYYLSSNRHPQNRRWFKNLGCVGQFLEIANTLWLLYIIGQQTFGGYNTCSCRSTIWGNAGGYVTFADSEAVRNNFRTKDWWIFGVALGCAPFVLGFFYAVREWSLQSHLWTSNTKNAKDGLERVRKWRVFTRFFYLPIRKLVMQYPIEMLESLFIQKRREGNMKTIKHTKLKWKPMSWKSNWNAIAYNKAIDDSGEQIHKAPGQSSRLRVLDYIRKEKEAIPIPQETASRSNGHQQDSGMFEQQSRRQHAAVTTPSRNSPRQHVSDQHHMSGQRIPRQPSSTPSHPNNSGRAESGHPSDSRTHPSSRTGYHRPHAQQPMSAPQQPYQPRTAEFIGGYAIIPLSDAERYHHPYANDARFPTEPIDR